MAARCTQCLYRYSEHGPICLICQRINGTGAGSRFEFERVRQERVRQRLAQLARVNLDPPPRPIIRTFVQRGIEYAVTWDGSIR